MTKGKLTGAISIQNVDRENAFGDSDVRVCWKYRQCDERGT